jgi:hypothetical protein
VVDCLGENGLAAIERRIGESKIGQQRMQVSFTETHLLLDGFNLFFLELAYNVCR